MLPAKNTVGVAANSNISIYEQIRSFATHGTNCCSGLKPRFHMANSGVRYQRLWGSRGGLAIICTLKRSGKELDANSVYLESKVDLVLRPLRDLLGRMGNVFKAGIHPDSCKGNAIPFHDRNLAGRTDSRRRQAIQV